MSRVRWVKVIDRHGLVHDAYLVGDDVGAFRCAELSQHDGNFVDDPVTCFACLTFAGTKAVVECAEEQGHQVLREFLRGVRRGTR